MTVQFKPKTIGIIGYGRFGQVLEQMFNRILPDTEVRIHSRSNPIDNKKFFDLESVCEAEVIIPAVPISAFDKTLANLAFHLKPGQIVMDICSVKVYPKGAMLRLLPKKVNIIATHPMFGPGTLETTKGSFTGLNYVVENVRCDKQIYESFIDLLKRAEFNITEMSADEHDKLAAGFQFTAQLTAFVLKELKIERSKIDTKSASVMLDFVDMIQTDSIQLLQDMYKYNPYCRVYLEKFDEAYNDILEKF